MPRPRELGPLTAGSLCLGLAASLALFVAPGASSAEALDAPPAYPIAELRARGPAALEELLSRDRRALATGAAAAELEAAIDAVAGQRYAAFSGLYWYTDLDLAERAAHQLHRPILALRLLGDLRDDLSCANSRLFRTTLYANTEVAAFLRSHFVLYWSSERPVPTVTIDFGDGRKLVRTTTGNSAHYVLDEDGHVLDVLPGLYAPAMFKRELEASLALAGQVRGMTDAQRIQATVAYHAAAATATDRAWRLAGGTLYIRGSRTLLGRGDLRSALASAQATTMSKAMVEVPDLERIGLVKTNEVPSDEAAWSAIGQKVWHIGDPDPDAQAPPRVRSMRALFAPPPLMVLDEASRELIARLYHAGPADPRASDAELARMIARLEHHIVADSALNQFTLRQRIHRQIVAAAQTDFMALNAWIYDQVFATPASDPWLGLHPRTDFTGLPGDGAVMP
jgi:hypothetical protein